MIISTRRRALAPPAAQEAASTGARSGSVGIPLIGLLLSVVAYLAQNVWGVLHVDDLVGSIRRLDPAGLFVAFGVIGVLEGTVLLCLYVPGTAMIVLLLLSLQPAPMEGLLIMAALSAGTLVGYGISCALGQTLTGRLPRLVGDRAVYRIRGLVEQYGLVGMVPAAFHPNHLALAFAALGMIGTRRLWAYFAAAAFAQAGWWAAYATAADAVVRTSPVTANNFQLYLAALFAFWLVYELVCAPKTG